MVTRRYASLSPYRSISRLLPRSPTIFNPHSARSCVNQCLDVSLRTPFNMTNCVKRISNPPHRLEFAHSYAPSHRKEKSNLDSRVTLIFDDPNEDPPYLNCEIRALSTIDPHGESPDSTRTRYGLRQTIPKELFPISSYGNRIGDGGRLRYSTQPLSLCSQSSANWFSEDLKHFQRRSFRLSSSYGKRGRSARG